MSGDKLNNTKTIEQEKQRQDIKQYFNEVLPALLDMLQEKIPYLDVNHLGVKEMIEVFEVEDPPVVQISYLLGIARQAKNYQGDRNIQQFFEALAGLPIGKPRLFVAELTKVIEQLPVDRSKVNEDTSDADENKFSHYSSGYTVSNDEPFFDDDESVVEEKHEEYALERTIFSKVVEDHDEANDWDDEYLNNHEEPFGFYLQDDSEEVDDSVDEDDNVNDIHHVIPKSPIKIAPVTDLVKNEVKPTIAQSSVLTDDGNIIQLQLTELEKKLTKLSETSNSSGISEMLNILKDKGNTRDEKYAGLISIAEAHNSGARSVIANLSVFGKPGRSTEIDTFYKGLAGMSADNIDVAKLSKIIHALPTEDSRFTQTKAKSSSFLGTLAKGLANLGPELMASMDAFAYSQNQKLVSPVRNRGPRG